MLYPHLRLISRKPVPFDPRCAKTSPSGYAKQPARSPDRNFDRSSRRFHAQILARLNIIQYGICTVVWKVNLRIPRFDLKSPSILVGLQYGITKQNENKTTPGISGGRCNLIEAGLRPSCLRGRTS